jgi:hypothetical protein
MPVPDPTGQTVPASEATSSLARNGLSVSQCSSMREPTAVLAVRGIRLTGPIRLGS